MNDECVNRCNAGDAMIEHGVRASFIDSSFSIHHLLYRPNILAKKPFFGVGFLVGIVVGGRFCVGLGVGRRLRVLRLLPSAWQNSSGDGLAGVALTFSSGLAAFVAALLRFGLARLRRARS